MKHNNRFIIAVLSAGILFSSCGKNFLDTNPTNKVPEDQVFNTVENAQTVLNGTWAYMMDNYLGGTFSNPGYGAILRVSDAMGSDVAVTTKYGFRDAYTFTEMIDNTKGRVAAFWTTLYKVIDNCNNVIARIDGINGDETQKKYIKGQALALRANSYLVLATFYQFNYSVNASSKVVPIYLEPATAATAGKPKATVQQLYDQIIADLTEAEKLLPGFDRGEGRRFKMNLDVVEGLFARTYLNMGNWTKAGEKAAAARAAYTLMPAAEYAKGFNDVNNVEWIWGHPQTPSQRVASDNFHFLDVSSPSSGYYSFMADPYFKDLFTSNDIRFKLFAWDTLPSREGLLRYEKFKFRADQTGDIVLMRAAEMYLIEAEAYARNGNIDKAAERLNDLRGARSAVLYKAAGQTIKQAVDTILVERRKELWGEGFSLSDILRTSGTVVRKAFVQANGDPIVIKVPRANGGFVSVNGKGHRAVKFPDGSAFVPNSKYYLFAIPDAEIKNNPNLDK